MINEIIRLVLQNMDVYASSVMCDRGGAVPLDQKLAFTGCHVTMMYYDSNDDPRSDREAAEGGTPQADMSRLTSE